MELNMRKLLMFICLLMATFQMLGFSIYKFEERFDQLDFLGEFGDKKNGYYILSEDPAEAFFFCNRTSSKVPFSHEIPRIAVHPETGKEYTVVGVYSAAFSYEGFGSYFREECWPGGGDRKTCSGYLERLYLPETLRYLERHSLYKTGLNEIDIPESVEWIGGYSFYDCVLLERVKMPDRVMVIEESTFHNCEKLRTINVPSQLEVIGPNAFNGCTLLESFDLPEDMRSIDYFAFAGCSQLKYAYIGNSMRKIGYNPWFHCGSMEKIIVSPYNEYFRSVDGALYNRYVTALISWPCAKGELKLPASVKTLRPWSVSDPSNPESYTIPEGIETIELDPQNLAQIHMGILNLPSSLKEIVLVNDFIPYSIDIQEIRIDREDPPEVITQNGRWGGNRYFLNVILRVPSGSKLKYGSSPLWGRFKIQETEESDIDQISADIVSDPEYYTLSGIKVAEPRPGDLLIRKIGNTVTKIIF